MSNEKEEKVSEDLTKKKNVKEVKKEEDLFIIEEFCNLKNLNKYHLDSLIMIFGNTEKKSVREWKNVLLKNKLIKEDLIK